MVESAPGEIAMAKITTDLDGSATIIMTDGMQVRLPPFNTAPNVSVQDVRNIATALLALADSLDKRLAALEKPEK